MRPARSRRVQAQRKFAQGAYVPPNVVAVAAADNRRDVAPDPRNVTVNNVSATGLLDSVSLQSHSHLTSQPVVIIERLRGRNPARDVPPPSQTETVEPRHRDNPLEQKNNNVATIKIPPDRPRLQTIKKKKEYKRVHPMALRFRRQSKLVLKNLIAETCAPLRKLASKHQENSSDEDEPLIFQKTRLKQTAKQLSTLKQTAARESAPKAKTPKPSHPKEKTPKPSPPKEKSSKKKPCKKRIKKETTRHETVTKEITISEATTTKSITNEISSKKTSELSVSETPVMDLLVTVEIKEDPTDEMDTPDDSVIVVVPIDPLTPDVLDDLVAPGVSVATDDPVLPPVPVMQDGSNVPMELSGLDSDEDSSESLPPLKYVFSKESDASEDDEHILHDASMDNDDVLGVKNVLEVPDDVPLNIGTSSAASDEVPEDTSDPDFPLIKSAKMKKDEMVQINMVDPAITRLRVASPEPGTSGMYGTRYSGHRRCLGSVATVEPSLKETLPKSQKRKGKVNNDVGLDIEPTEREGETEVIEIDNEDVDQVNDNRGHVYLPRPSCFKTVLHGKEVLGARLVRGEENKKPEFALDREQLLDQLIETLTNKKGRSDNLEGQNDSPKSRSISSDSTPEMSDATTHDQETSIRIAAKKKKLHRLAIKKKLAEAELMHNRIREEKEREIARIEEENRRKISQIMAEKDSVVAEKSRYHERVSQMEKQKEREVARLTSQIRADVISKLEAKRRMHAEVDSMAATLAKEKDAKKMDPEELSDQDAPGTSGSLLTTDRGMIIEAPIYYPTEEEFRDPLQFCASIWSEAVKYGICKVVPPPGWKPQVRVDDEMRFDVTNQYISRLFRRWGPAAREQCAIKLAFAQQQPNFTRGPLLDGVEVNLPKLYHVVQWHGGLETVCNKKRWGKVAEDMKFNKGPNTERKLDQIYVKYVLPYDSLSYDERQDIMRKVDNAWSRKNQKLFDRAVNPLNRQKRMLGLMDSSDDETEDTVAAVNEAEDCIIKGAVMNRAKFKKIATMIYENTFGQASTAGEPVDVNKIEEYYWNLVTLGSEHVCVHTAAIDTGDEGYGFIKNKSDSYGRHPWNPKMVSQNPKNVLRYLGPVLGVTVPTLLLGMVFSTSCWHKDPHAVSWLEYQLSGPDRIWYGIPAIEADNFKNCVEYLCPTFCQNKGLWLSSDIAMIPPKLLREHNVTLSRVTQKDGEYIMAFPNAYTCCISTGYTESESVYFAMPCWLENLWTVFKEARESCEPTMFAMEHLLYNIGKDPNAERSILKIAQPLYDKMLREEVTNRQMLQERGLSVIQDLLSANTSRKKNKADPYNPRDQDECEYCRATLYLSKVKGLTGKNTVVCLEHALKLLETEKHKDENVQQLQFLVHVSVKELNTVHDDMKRRLGISTT